MDSEQKVIRWQGLGGGEREHLVLTTHESGIIAESVYVSGGGSEAFGVWYQLHLSPSWEVREFRARCMGEQRELVLRRNGSEWTDAHGQVLSELSGTTDLDLSISPFTNSLPINRLQLSKSESADIRVAYVSFPQLEVFADIQRYTCREPKKQYLFDSVDTDFKAEIEVDEHGLVVHYPGLFIRIG